MNHKPTATEGGAETELHSAAWSGDINWAKEVLKLGIDVNVLDSIQESPLHGASAWNHSEMVKFLLDAGANPNLKNNQGDTALHWACSHGSVETLQTLINHGAKLVDNGFGQSPLEVAKKHNRQEIIQWIKKNT